MSSLACLTALSGQLHASTQAYWRFEESSSGAVPASGTGGSVTNTILDASGNGNHMQTWNTGTAPSYSDSVFPTPNPSNYLELSHAGNYSSLDFAGQPRDIYTSNKPLNTKPLNAWTIEASFCLDTLNRWQVVVGKDGNPVGGQPPVTIKVRANNVLEVGLVDGSGTVRNVVSTLPLSTNTWYHVAATATPSALMLYLKPQGSSEYTFLGTTAISGAFFNSSTQFNQPWIVGRGMWNGANADWLDGKIDEVRICDTALMPSQFLGSTEMVDADVDGLPDDWEVTYGLSSDPTTGGIGNNGPDGDSDNDGFTNAQEWSKQSSPVAYTYDNIVVGEDISMTNTLSSGGFGSSNSVSGGGSTFLFGDDNSATNQYAGFIAGSENQALAPTSGPGDSNILLGSKNVINPPSSTAGSNILGSILMGVENATSQTQSWVLGLGNVGQTNSVILGTYNAPVSNASLIVGNGSGAAARSNGLVVLKNGTVQIPSGVLQLGSENVATQNSILPQISSYLEANGYLRSAPYAVVDNAEFAVGTGAGAWGLGSLAFGNYAQASASGAGGAVTIGSSSVGMGAFTTVLGSQSYAYGEGATAIGSSVSAGAKYSVAIGAYSNTYADYSVALGGAISTSYGEIALGPFHKVNWNVHSDTWVPLESQFVVGNGSGGADRSNAITTLKNGRTSLTNKYWNATTPTAVPSNAAEASNGEALSVEGHAVIQGNTTLKGNTVLEGKVTLAQPQGDISMGIYGN